MAGLGAVGSKEADRFHHRPWGIEVQYLNKERLRGWDHYPIVVKAEGGNLGRFKAGRDGRDGRDTEVGGREVEIQDPGVR